MDNAPSSTHAPVAQGCDVAALHGAPILQDRAPMWTELHGFTAATHESLATRELMQRIDARPASSRSRQARPVDHRLPSTRPLQSLSMPWQVPVTGVDRRIGVVAVEAGVAAPPPWRIECRMGPTEPPLEERIRRARV
jgi:hypothetical protein